MNTPFAITVNGTYTRNEIPPRCRKPRPVTYDTSTVTTIESVSCEEAPVAFRVTEVNPRGVSEIRTHDGKLYAPYLPFHRQEDPTVPGDSRFPADVTLGRQSGRSFLLGSPANAEEFASAAGNHFSRFLVIDNGVWVETAEPAYLVVTFGLEGVNGSTGFMVGTCTDSGPLFRADEFDAALAHAIEVAEGRGDDASRYREQGEGFRAIEVLVPEAVTLVAVPPAPREVSALRHDYSQARRRLDAAQTPDEETEAFDEVVRLRQEIIARGHVPVESEEARPYEARAVAQVA